MPAPVIILAAAAVGGAEIIGAAVIEAAIGEATVSSAVATAVGSGVIAGTVTAASGGDVSDVLESAVKGAATAGIASGVGEYAGGGVAGGAAGSAAATFAVGGSGDDIIRNAVAGGAGTAISQRYGAEAGNAAKAYIATGSAENAVISAAATGLTKDAKASRGVKTAEMPTGVQLAQADANITSDEGRRLDIGLGGPPIFADSYNASSVELPQGTRLMFVRELEDRPLGSGYDPDLNAWIVREQPFKGYEDTGGFATGSKSPGFLTEAPSWASGYAGRGGGGRGTGTAAYRSPAGTAPAFRVDVTDTREPTFRMDVTDTREPIETPEEESYSPAGTEPATPGFLTSTSISPKKPLQSTLLQTFRADMAPLSATGLTAYRPAGEIESEETGKRRQDVWNEASLRLKDALGL